jgi:hypothetical protein
MSKREQGSTNPTTDVTASQLQREQQVLINKALDETRDNIKKATNEAKKDISTYAEQFTTLQERSIETARDIAEEHIESQREIINSFNQSVWTPYVENVVNRTTTAFPGMFSLPRTEVYTNTISNLVDNFVTATRLANKTVFANAELINTSLQQARNNVREYSRIGVNAAKNFHEATNEVAKIGFSAVESTTVSTQRRQ